MQDKKKGVICPNCEVKRCPPIEKKKGKVTGMM